MNLDLGKLLLAAQQAKAATATPVVTLGSPVTLPAQVPVSTEAPVGIKISGPQPLNNADQIIGMISTLQSQLQTNAPGYESLLHKIHRALAADEDLSHILSEEQIGVVVAGLSRRKNIVIFAEKAKSTSKSASKITTDEL